jgi:TrmH family RNA methyltransferase
LVEPEYQQNIGYCARVMKNFGFSNLWIVNPKVQLGDEAVMYSKHAVDVLKKAKVVKRIADATSGCSIVVGTTAIKPGGRTIVRKAITPKALKLGGKTAILIGREGNGLSPEELEGCDIVVRIPTDEEYPTLNISHALAILLYEISSRMKGGQANILYEGLSTAEQKALLKKFDSLVDASKEIRRPKIVKLAFRRVIARGIRSQTEGRALLQVLKNIKLKE